VVGAAAGAGRSDAAAVAQRQDRIATQIRPLPDRGVGEPRQRFSIDEDLSIVVGPMYVDELTWLLRVDRSDDGVAKAPMDSPPLEACLSMRREGL